MVNSLETRIGLVKTEEFLEFTEFMEFIEFVALAGSIEFAELPELLRLARHYLLCNDASLLSLRGCHY